MKTSHKGLLEDEIPKFYNKISNAVIDLYDHTLALDHHVITKVVEKESDGAGILADPGRSNC